MFTTNISLQFYSYIRVIFCAFLFSLLLTNATLAQAPDCSIVTYNTNVSGQLEIDNLDRLQCISEDLTADYILLNDIDASPTATWNVGAGFDPIGSEIEIFSGRLIGNGFVITGLYINRPDEDYIGLIAHHQGEVTDLGLENIDVSGGNRVGGLAGYLRGFDERIFVTGSVSGDEEVGGFGGASNFGTLRYSYSTASIHAGDGPVGGLIGDIGSFFNLINCYASGPVTMDGERLSGGSVGFISSNNNVVVSNIYWNIETTLHGFGIGNPVDLSEMKSESTFASWNFSSIWTINEGNSYPYLQAVTPAVLPGINDTALVTPFPGGVGTTSQPFEISTIEQLQAAEEYENFIFELVNDIDASGTSDWNNGAGFDPLGSSENPFSGSLFGNGYIISGLNINRPDSNYVGLFARKNGFVIDIGLENISIVGNDFTGGIAGENSGEISEVFVTGSIKGSDFVGGVVGMQYPALYSIYSAICADENAICDSYSLAVVEADSVAGGLVGNIVGGINTITGFRYGRVYESYAAGKVTGIDHIGGLVGLNTGEVSNSYWNTETSGLIKSEGGAPLNTNEMKFQSSFNNWGFLGAWLINEGESYPYLSEVTPATLPGSDQEPLFSGGSGFFTDPFQIQNIREFQYVGNNLSSFFILTDDINAAGTALWNNGAGFTPIGNSEIPFSGKINGNGYSVNRLTINRPSQDSVGVFGVIGSGAEITNLGIKGIDISGQNLTGGLVGVAEDSTEIENVYVTGQISGNNNVGGLLGISKGSLKYAYSIATVSGNENVGGIAGSLEVGSEISNSYAAGNVEGVNNSGGVVGSNADTTISESYWNTETAGVLEGVGQGDAGETTGLTTVEMMNPDSYSNWDFDFEGDWFIVSGHNYPWLQKNEQNPAPVPVTLLSPQNGSNIAIPSDLEWKNFPGANSYRIEIGTDADLETVIIDSSNVQSLTLNLTSTTLFEENQTYYWRIQPDNTNWSVINSFVVQLVTSNEDGSDIPDSFALLQNYPNPFNPSTNINFDLPKASNVVIEIYSVLGQRLMELTNKRYTAGRHLVNFDASHLSSGVYFYRIKAGEFSTIKKMILAK